MLDFNHCSSIAEQINAAVDAALEAEHVATARRCFSSRMLRASIAA